jgi:hypothetical protein
MRTLQALDPSGECSSTFPSPPFSLRLALHSAGIIGASTFVGLADSVPNACRPTGSHPPDPERAEPGMGPWELARGSALLGAGIAPSPAAAARPPQDPRSCSPRRRPSPAPQALGANASAGRPSSERSQDTLPIWPSSKWHEGRRGCGASTKEVGLVFAKAHRGNRSSVQRLRCC